MHITYKLHSPNAYMYILFFSHTLLACYILIYSDWDVQNSNSNIEYPKSNVSNKDQSNYFKIS
jgi:hypothetical protein